MPHLHDLYDFVVSVFIVHRDKILLVFHKKYNEWLPIGGHIELDEDPEEALYREIQEECGLKVKILAHTPPIAHPGVKPIPTPSYVDVHRIDRRHKHIAFVYFGVSASDRVKLHTREHATFRWFKKTELKDPCLKLVPSIYFYCLKALQAANE